MDSHSKPENRVVKLPFVPRPSIGIVFKTPEDYMLHKDQIECFMANVVFDGKPISFMLTRYAFYSFGFEGLEILVRNSDVRVKIMIQRRIQDYKFLKLCEFYGRTYYLEIIFYKESPYNLGEIVKKYKRTITEDKADFPFLFSMLSF